MSRRSLIHASAIVGVIGMLSSDGDPLRAAIPEHITFQGILKDANGVPVNDTVDLAIRIYDDSTGGTFVYEDYFLGVSVSDGVLWLGLEFSAVPA